MNKAQWITAGIAILAVIGIYAATEKQIFGPSSVKASPMEVKPAAALSVDSILSQAKERLSPEQVTRLNFLEHSISRGDVKDQKIHIYHQLSRFWLDSARIFEPYAWYTAEAARLENSEKSLTFAAHLFLNNLVDQKNPDVKHWEAFQAKDLFERSLKLNAQNDSSKIGLGAVYLFGEIAMPMQGISMIREVADRDSNNVYAQMTLGQASLVSGQLEKGLARFKRVVRIEPNNWEAMIRVAETEEQMGNKEEAINWYQKTLPLIKIAEVKQEVEARIAELKK
ncbi:MAG: tetratricopeptide repeat protein [Flavisolibacter sp.]